MNHIKSYQSTGGKKFSGQIAPIKVKEIYLDENLKEGKRND